MSFLSLPVDLFLISLVSRLYANRKANEDWMSDLPEAHTILVATRSQASVVSTHSLDRLNWDGHIVTPGTRSNLSYRADWMASGNLGEGIFAIDLGDIDNAAMGTETRTAQRVYCVALYGIHLGALRYLNSSTILGLYPQMGGGALIVSRDD